MTQGDNPERNDRIEAAVLVTALASLGLLVALAVSTSVTAVSSPAQATDTAQGAAGIAPANPDLTGAELR